MRIVGDRIAEFTLVESSSVDDKVATPLKSICSLKQEDGVYESVGVTNFL
jgi:hypothetical protein